MKRPIVRPPYIGLPWSAHARDVGRVLDLDVDHDRVLEHRVARDVAVVEAQRVRAAALQAEQVAPRSLDHHELAAGREEHELAAGVAAALIGHERLPHVVRRVGRAGAVGDAARELPAVGGPLRDPDRRGHRRRAEVAVAEGLGLRPLGEERAHVERVVGGERRAPGGRRAPARELDADPGERRDVERVAAVAARHERPVDPRGLQLAVDVLGVEAALLDLRLALDQHRLQRRRPCDELARREIRLRRGDRSVGHGMLSSCDQVKCQT